MEMGMGLVVRTWLFREASRVGVQFIIHPEGRISWAVVMPCTLVAVATTPRSREVERILVKNAVHGAVGKPLRRHDNVGIAAWGHEPILELHATVWIHRRRNGWRGSGLTIQRIWFALLLYLCGGSRAATCAIGWTLPGNVGYLLDIFIPPRSCSLVMLRVLGVLVLLGLGDTGVTAVGAVPTLRLDAEHGGSETAEPHPRRMAVGNGLEEDRVRGDLVPVDLYTVVSWQSDNRPDGININLHP